jgi:DNA-binding GntR family transcriptional regulator
MPNLQLLDQPASLSKLAYEALLKSILSGQMRAQEIYNEMVLAKDLGISRTPVREALLELAANGLVTFLPRKGIIVNQFTGRDIDEIFEIRRAIEGAVVEKLAGMSPSPDLEDIYKAIEKQKAAMKKGDFDSFLREDRSYHVCFCKLTGNQRMVAIAENLRNMIHLMGTQALMLPGRAETVIKEHELIAEAIERSDSVMARTAMIDHLHKSEAAVKEALRRQRAG